MTVSWFRFLFLFSYFSSNRLFLATFFNFRLPSLFNWVLEHCTRILISTMNSVHLNITNSCRVRFYATHRSTYVIYLDHRPRENYQFHPAAQGSQQVKVVSRGQERDSPQTPTSQTRKHHRIPDLLNVVMPCVKVIQLFPSAIKVEAFMKNRFNALWKIKTAKTTPSSNS